MSIGAVAVWYPWDGKLSLTNYLWLCDRLKASVVRSRDGDGVRLGGFEAWYCRASGLVPSVGNALTRTFPVRWRAFALQGLISHFRGQLGR